MVSGWMYLHAIGQALAKVPTTNETKILGLISSSIDKMMKKLNCFSQNHMVIQGFLLNKTVE